MDSHEWQLVDGGPEATIPWEWCSKCGTLRVFVSGMEHDNEYFKPGGEGKSFKIKDGRPVQGSIRMPPCRG